jgi:hypothetical protein
MGGGGVLNVIAPTRSTTPNNGSANYEVNYSCTFRLIAWISEVNGFTSGMDTGWTKK